MSKVLIIADDLTGANANCALMKKIGLRAVSFLGDSINEIPSGIDVIAATSDSRAMTREDAENAVKERLSVFKNEEFSIYSKRIDSTLRGNLGTELRAYQNSFSEKRVGICVPAFPDSGRIVVDGKLYVNGTLLMNTDAAKDTKTPVVSNYVVNNFEKDYKGKIAHIPIEKVENDNLTDIIRILSEESDLLIFDAITNEHIKNIAEAVMKSNIKFISVDPGPFTKELTAYLYKRESIQTKAMAIVGSVTKITIDQLQELRKAYDSYQIDVNPLKLLNPETIKEEIQKARIESEKHLKNVDLLIITTTPDDISKRLDLVKIAEEKDMIVDDISIILSRGLANIAKKILDETDDISGIFSSGGDITVALAEELSSIGIEVRDEVIPLAAYGRLIGGTKPGLKIVSKGGMVGGPDAMIKCIERILKLED